MIKPSSRKSDYSLAHNNLRIENSTHRLLLSLIRFGCVLFSKNQVHINQLKL